MPEIEHFIIFVFCLLGAGIHCYFLGRKEGVFSTVEYLEMEGVLEVEREDEGEE